MEKLNIFLLFVQHISKVNSETKENYFWYKAEKKNVTNNTYDIGLAHA